MPCRPLHDRLSIFLDRLFEGSPARPSQSLQDLLPSVVISGCNLGPIDLRHEVFGKLAIWIVLAQHVENLIKGVPFGKSKDALILDLGIDESGDVLKSCVLGVDEPF